MKKFKFTIRNKSFKWRRRKRKIPHGKNRKIKSGVNCLGV